jgi:hypothetical protein
LADVAFGHVPSMASQRNSLGRREVEAPLSGVVLPRTVLPKTLETCHSAGKLATVVAPITPSPLQLRDGRALYLSRSESVLTMMC